MSITLTYMNALRDYLNAQYTTDPPTIATIGLVKVGSFQDDPTIKPAIITIHPHNPMDGSFSDPHFELIEKNRGVGIQTSQLQGAYMEIGGGYHNWLYWWVQAKYFQTRTGANQEDAQIAWDDLMTWLTKKINAAQPGTLAMTTEDNQDLIQTAIISIVPREAGGRTNQYIWNTIYKIRGIAHGEFF